MTIRKTVTLVEEINSEYGATASPPLRRVAIAAVFENPLAGKAAGADLKPLIEYSLELGASLTKTTLATLGASPAQLRAYTKAALVGIGGDLEHGAAMIHPRLGMAMRRAIKRSRVIIPGHAKVGRRALPYCSKPSLRSQLLRSRRQFAAECRQSER